ARPWKASRGLPLGSRPISISRNATPRQPVPRAFIAASFAAKRPATCSANARGWRRDRRISPSRKTRARKRSACRSRTSATRPTSVRSRPSSRPAGSVIASPAPSVRQPEEAHDPVAQRLRFERALLGGADEPVGGLAPAFEDDGLELLDERRARLEDRRERRLVDFDQRGLGQ